MECLQRYNLLVGFPNSADVFSHVEAQTLREVEPLVCISSVQPFRCLDLGGHEDENDRLVARLEFFSDNFLSAVSHVMFEITMKRECSLHFCRKISISCPIYEFSYLYFRNHCTTVSNGATVR